MMHPSCLMRVEEYIKDKDEEVRKVIRNLCVTSSTNLRIPDLKKTCNPITDKAPEKCRIALLVFDNFRTYPDGDDNYGLSFLDSQSKISSLLLVGQNGSGKSTLYTALEKILWDIQVILNCCHLIQTLISRLDSRRGQMEEMVSGNYRIVWREKN